MFGERRRMCWGASEDGFTSAETLDSIEKSRAVRLAGNQDQYKALSVGLELF